VLTKLFRACNHAWNEGLRILRYRPVGLLQTATSVLSPGHLTLPHNRPSKSAHQG